MSEVQALLRTHGTEIRLQTVNGARSAASPNLSVSTSTPNGSPHPLPMEYYPLYGVEAVLNNRADAGPSYR